MFKPFYRHFKRPINQLVCRNGNLGFEVHKRLAVRLYSSGDKKQVDTTVEDKSQFPNLMKDTAPETRKVEPDIEKQPQPSSFADGSSSSSSSSDGKNKYRVLLYLSPVIVAALIYQLWKTSTMTTPSEESKVVSKLEMKRKRRKEMLAQKVPPTSAAIPSQVPYLLIGGGTASFSAFRAIKSSDPTAQILMISNEPYYPYMRPPLSKEMFYDEDRESVRKLNFKQWNGKQRSLFYEHEDFYSDIDSLITSKNGGVAVARGWNVMRVDASARKAYLEDGKEIAYKKCLIATGARPKNLPVFEKASRDIKDKVMLYRNIFDFEELEDMLEEGAKSVAIVGGGFLGSELACALSRRGKGLGLTVHQIYKEDGNMAKVLPQYLSKWTTRKVQSEGVNVIGQAEVTDVKMRDNRVVLHLSNKSEVEADQVIVAVGVEPNTDLARTSGLEVDPEIGGFLVNAELEARSNLYIAGDCACFYDMKLGRRRIEHHDNAVVSGRLAGENMTGAAKPYTHQSMLWSDLGPDVGYEALGIVDSSLPTFGVYAKPDKQVSEKEEKEKDSNTSEEYTKGVVFYLKNDIIVGIVLWNIFNRIGIARQILNEEAKFEDLTEVAKLFQIHEN